MDTEKKPHLEFQYQKQVENPSLQRFVRRSILFHLILAIVFILVNFTFFGKPIEYHPAIRVDLVALPDVKKADLNKFKPSAFEDMKEKLDKAQKQPKEEIATEEDVMSLKKKPLNKKAALKSAIDRIKALTEIENEVKSDEKKPRIQAKGNILSKGDSLSGDLSETGNDTNAYISKMQGKLRDNWNLPVWLTTQDFSAKIIVFLDRTGYVRQTVWEKKSGNAQFDDYILKTVKMSQPFGAPPSEIVEAGITLGFPL